VAGNPRRNALFGIVLESCGLRRLDGGRTRARTWDPLIKRYTVCNSTRNNFIEMFTVERAELRSLKSVLHSIAPLNRKPFAIEAS
jgi:hypothetical protein